jgi:hypothetical protein
MSKTNIKYSQMIFVLKGVEISTRAKFKEICQKKKRTMKQEIVEFMERYINEHGRSS